MVTGSGWKSCTFRKYPTVWLMVILFLAFAVRTYNLSAIPNGLFWDEAAHLNDAHALITTGHDNHGHPIPLYIESLGDWELPFYIYFASLVVGLFGKSVFAIRLASVLLGTSSVFLIFFLGKKWFNETVGLISALFLAFSPWHVHYSRLGATPIAWPFMLLLFLVVYECTKESTKIKQYGLCISAIIAGLNLYTYHAAKVWTPIFLIVWLWCEREHLSRKQMWIFVGIVALMAFPLAIFWPSAGQARQMSMLVFAGDHPIQDLAGNYAAYFSPSFLFQNGDKDYVWHVRNVGQLYWVDALFLVGLWFLWKSRHPKRYLLTLWLLIYPVIGAVVNDDVPQASRTFNGVLVFLLLSAYGICCLYQIMLQRENSQRVVQQRGIHQEVVHQGVVYQKFFIGLISILFLINTGWFGYQYFVEYPVYGTYQFHFGLDKAMKLADKAADLTDSIAEASSGVVVYYGKVIQGKAYAQVYSQHPERYVQCRDLSPCLNPNKNDVFILRPDEYPIPADNVIVDPEGHMAFKILTTHEIKQKEKRCFEKCSRSCKGLFKARFIDEVCRCDCM